MDIMIAVAVGVFLLVAWTVGGWAIVRMGFTRDGDAARTPAHDAHDDYDDNFGRSTTGHLPTRSHEPARRRPACRVSVRPRCRGYDLGASGCLARQHST